MHYITELTNTHMAPQRCLWDDSVLALPTGVCVPPGPCETQLGNGKHRISVEPGMSVVLDGCGSGPSVKLAVTQLDSTANVLDAYYTADCVGPAGRWAVFDAALSGPGVYEVRVTGAEAPVAMRRCDTEVPGGPFDIEADRASASLTIAVRAVVRSTIPPNSVAKAFDPGAKVAAMTQGTFATVTMPAGLTMASSRALLAAVSGATAFADTSTSAAVFWGEVGNMTERGAAITAAFPGATVGAAANASLYSLGTTGASGDTASSIGASLLRLNNAGGLLWAETSTAVVVKQSPIESFWWLPLVSLGIGLVGMTVGVLGAVINVINFRRNSKREKKAKPPKVLKTSLPQEDI